MLSELFQKFFKTLALVCGVTKNVFVNETLADLLKERNVRCQSIRNVNVSQRTPWLKELYVMQQQDGATFGNAHQS